MNFDDEFMQEAIKRINQLQKEVKDKAYKIEGAKEYIQEQIKIYEKSEILKKKIKLLQKKEQKLTNEFFAKDKVTKTLNPMKYSK